MAKTNVTQWDTTAANNTDLNSIPIDGAVTKPSQVDNLIREMMAQIKSGISASYFIPASPTLTSPTIDNPVLTTPTVRRTDDGTSGAALILEHVSASPAVGDVIAALYGYGRDSGGNSTQYGGVQVFINDPTDGSEDGRVLIVNRVAGTFTAIANFAAGLYMQGATGGDKGSGTVNATALYVNGQSVATDTISGFIGAPADKSYTLVLKCPYGGTINETVTKSASGTCTATFKINTTALGGTANSVSSSEQTQTHASANTFVAGDDIVVTISSNSSCVDMAFTIKVTKSF